VFLGPPGTGKSHLSIALGVQAARRGYRVAFATAHEWVLRLAAAKRTGRLESELERLGRIQLVIVDEVGYIPFDPEAGALFFALISSRYERRSLVVNSNKTFSAWAEIFGDPVAVAAMVDRLVHHAEVIVLRGDSYRLKGKGKEVLQPEGLREVSRFRPALPVQVSTGVDKPVPGEQRTARSRRPGSPDAAHGTRCRFRAAAH
jgi:DNA replication protein DnaC